MVVATPGRLLDLIKQGYVHLEGLQTLVLDEADRMLDMGFFPAIRRILEYVPRKRQTLMFSATMKPEIRDLANSILNNPVSIQIVPKQKTTELVEQSVCFVPQKQKTRLLIELLIQHNPSRAIVFSRTKHGADRIVRNLVAAGFKSEAIHANKSQNKRQRILDEFKGQRPPILVATDIAARGIDVDLVSHVYLHDMPTEEETYVHRIGRSGRAGATGIAISLCDSEERRMLKSIEKLIGMKIDVLEVPGFDMNQHVEESAPREWW
jgi:ATP-dependent RNA helicase RhlE